MTTRAAQVLPLLAQEQTAMELDRKRRKGRRAKSIHAELQGKIPTPLSVRWMGQWGPWGLGPPSGSPPRRLLWQVLWLEGKRGGSGRRTMSASKHEEMYYLTKGLNRKSC